MRTDKAFKTVISALIACALLLLVPGTASAHAHLKRSEPSAGANVTAPHVLRFWFSEEPELTLTTVTVTDSSGVPVALGVPSRDAAGALVVLVTIKQELAAGRYVVRWRTAAMDGHPSNGFFSFRVLAPVVTSSALSPTPVVAPMSHMHDMTLPPAHTGAASTDTDVTSPAFVVTRLVSYAALLVLIGAVAFRLAVLPRMSAEHAPVAGALQRPLANGAMGAAALFVVMAVIRLALQCQMMRGDIGMSQLVGIATSTKWGGVWQLQFVAGIIATSIAWMPRERSNGGWTRLAFVCVVLAFSVSMGGHAATADRMRTFAEFDDTLHILAASAWLGSLFWLVVVGLGSPLAVGSSRAQHVAALVQAFSPVALMSSALVVFTGVVSAWPRLGAVSDLWTTPYGQALFRKLVMVAMVIVVGAYNWRRVRPALGTDVATSRLRRSSSIELGIGLLVLLFTSLLVATPIN